MGNSLQDQFLKTGLVDKQQANKAKKNVHKKSKQQRNSKEKIVDENKLRVQQAQAKKTARDRELNRQQKAQAEQRAIAAQVKQLIEMNRLPRDKAEVPYNFTEETRIKKIYVTDTQHDQLSRGLLAIVRLGEAYELVPAVVAEKIRPRDEASIILINESQKSSEEDDLYADYKVPDDLMW
ncbi:MAG: DUF2058 domain-containing protein [endosymbiont of Seepiophila jonesi]|uniref:DUF2058 domain-containing protein n=1 Tax=endosymbiont of Lamellibrachia luymesi TaxID=2200907 RepID=A0A370E3X9_9GAMM|nr:MAG: DUF2058 domain-containing protein [endosymbiont of Seepiophila jonesi]RDH93437.1 MAG: DUF2058 domain-containing protein [endosymbiont of Lamellibrachia luymesi]